MIQLFKNLFGGKGHTVKDLSALKVDMHSHLAPGIDDGSKSAEESVALIKALRELGYEQFITTPHVMQDYYRNNPETIGNAVNQIKAKLKEEGLQVPLSFAAEYYSDENLTKLCSQDNLLTFGNKMVLFELSYINEPVEIKSLIFDMKIKGYKPILAHPERYTYYYTDFRKYEELFDFEVLFQLNLGSLIGAYSPMAKKIAEKLIERNMISLVGTDTHNLNHVRSFQRVLESKSLAKLIDSGRLMNQSLAL